MSDFAHGLGILCAFVAIVEAGALAIVGPILRRSLGELRRARRRLGMRVELPDPFDDAEHERLFGRSDP